MKRLVILIENLEMGGAQNMVLELVKNISTSEYMVAVICCGRKKNSVVEERLEKICDVFYMNITGHIKLSDVTKVLKKIKSLKPDVLHAHLGGVTYALPYSLIHRKPLVVTAHTKPEKAFSRLNEKMLRFALKTNFVKLVAVSDENHLASKKYFGIGDTKCFSINNGIDENRFFRKEHEGFAYINIARQDKNKNQALLIRCFKKIHDHNPDTRLILAGDGPDHTDLKDLAESLGVSDFVEFTGVVPDTENYLAKSDVFVLSSYREAMPLSVLEAMAAGLPIISTDVGGLKDVVKDNGILVEAGNEDAFYNAMKKMYETDSAQMEIYKKQSLKLVEDYTAGKMADKYCNLYEDLIKK